MPLTVIATLKARDGREEESFRELQVLVEPTRKETGCLIYELHRSHEDSGLFMFTESWASRPEWDTHMQTPHLAAFGAKQDDLAASWTLFVGEKVAGGGPL